MSNLIFGEVCGHPTGLHMAYPTVAEGVHTAASDSQVFADGIENKSANFPVHKWRPSAGLKQPPGRSGADAHTKHFQCHRVEKHGRRGTTQTPSECLGTGKWEKK